MLAVEFISDRKLWKFFHSYFSIDNGIRYDEFEEKKLKLKENTDLTHGVYFSVDMKCISLKATVTYHCISSSISLD